eukprot:4584412-Karenia_brevis.AAC.1
MEEAKQSQQSQQHYMGPSQSNQFSLQLLSSSAAQLQQRQQQGTHDLTTDSLVMFKVRPGPSQHKYAHMQETRLWGGTIQPSPHWMCHQ